MDTRFLPARLNSASLSLALVLSLFFPLLPAGAQEWDDVPGTGNQSMTSQPQPQQPVPQGQASLPARAGLSFPGSPPAYQYPPQYYTQGQLPSAAAPPGVPFSATPSRPLPGQPLYQQHGPFSASPYQDGFFAGLRREDLQDASPIDFSQEGPFNPSGNTEWAKQAKQQIKMRYFQDGTEHFGNQDPGGFF
jgi:hypothetical protein